MTTLSAVRVLCIAAALFLLVATRAEASTRPAWLTDVEWAVALCETGGNFRHRTRNYQGAWGFRDTSWDWLKPKGYPADADLATPWQQTVVMRRIRARFGWSGWGCYTGGGYLYWMGR